MSNGDKLHCPRKANYAVVTPYTFSISKIELM